jgi:hypothetical protein
MPNPRMEIRPGFLPESPRVRGLTSGVRQLNLLPGISPMATAGAGNRGARSHSSDHGRRLNKHQTSFLELEAFVFR